MKATVIGCGVSGLTSAILLSESGYQVEIIAEKLPHETVSAKAAAIWFPYEIKPVDKANQWSLVTYKVFEELSANKYAGISMAPLTLFLEKESDAWWQDAFPKESLVRLTEKDCDPTHLPAYRAIVPIAETPIYLNYLMDRFAGSGGTIYQQKVEDISQLANQTDLLVNCTGLGARQLLTDREMYPIYGQIVKIDRVEGVHSVTDNKVAGKPANEVAYIVERSDCLVLGGTVIKDRENERVEDEYTQRIIDRCRILEPKLRSLSIQSVTAGLRPGRTSVRLERIDNIIHNYGHGGGGYTVSWGCAKEVLALAREI